MKYDKFVKYIKEYESDTFSAEGSQITDKEANLVAEKFLASCVDNRMDGVTIDVYLDAIRDDTVNRIADQISQIDDSELPNLIHEIHLRSPNIERIIGILSTAQDIVNDAEEMEKLKHG